MEAPLQKQKRIRPLSLITGACSLLPSVGTHIVAGESEIPSNLAYIQREEKKEKEEGKREKEEKASVGPAW